MPNENSLPRRAVKFVKDYEEKRGREVLDVQTKKEFKGFDLFSFSKDKKDIRTIEVKGTTRPNAIPDFFETEFTREKRMIATHLYVVYYEAQEKPRLYIIPSKEIKPEELKETRHLRLSSSFKTKRMKDYEFPV